MNNSIMSLINKIMFIISIIMTLSSKSLFFIWFMMEISLILFISMHSQKNMSTYNNFMKYFLSQSLASSLFILLIMAQSYNNYNHTNMMILMNIIMLIKLGLFPFNSWYFQSTQNMEWKMWFIINSAQKIIPIWIISNSMNSNFMNTMISINAVYSSMEMWSQTSMRWLLNCSSMNHLSWMIMSFNSSLSIWEIYMCLYIILNYLMWKMMEKNNHSSLSNLSSMSQQNTTYILSFTTMNFMGLPPFLGFLPKMLIMKNVYSPLTTITLIINNTFMAFMYMYMIKNNLNNYLWKKIHKYNQDSKNLFIMIQTIFYLFMLILYL